MLWNQESKRTQKYLESTIVGNTSIDQDIIEWIWIGKRYESGSVEEGLCNRDEDADFGGRSDKIM